MGHEDFSKPAGFDDHDPEACRTRRAVEAKLIEVFAEAGYGEVAVPTAEYVELYHRDRVGEEVFHQLFVAPIAESAEFPAWPPGSGAPDGALGREAVQVHELALRFDLTAPIARWFATRLLRGDVSSGPPTRVACAGQVFRNRHVEDGEPGTRRELRQVGVELIGARGTDADSEILLLAVRAARAVGLHPLRVRLGHAGLLRELFSSLGVPERGRDVVIRWLERAARTARAATTGGGSDGERGLPTGVADHGRAVERVLELVGRGREPAAFVEEARRLAATGEAKSLVDALATLWQRAADEGVEVEISPATSRGIGYYTGMTFALHAGRDPRYLVAGGGRYDDLHRQIYGRARETLRVRRPESPLPPVPPAAHFAGVGLAFGLEAVAGALSGLHGSESPAHAATPNNERNP